MYDLYIAPKFKVGTYMYNNMFLSNTHTLYRSISCSGCDDDDLVRWKRSVCAGKWSLRKIINIGVCVRVWYQRSKPEINLGP